MPVRTTIIPIELRPASSNSDLRNQSQLRASGTFEAIEQEESKDHPSAVAASQPVYNSSHTHPRTSTNHQPARESRKQSAEEKRKRERR